MTAATFRPARCAIRASPLGGVLVALLIGTALLSLVWTPHPPTEIDIAAKLQGADARAHWLGTDSLGRDIVSLLLVGAQNSIAVGVIAVGIGLVFGVALGLLAAARRGWVEELVMRGCRLHLRVPGAAVGDHADRDLSAPGW